MTQRRQKAMVDARSTLAAIPVTQSSLRRHSIQYFARGGEQGRENCWRWTRYGWEGLQEALARESAVLEKDTGDFKVRLNHKASALLWLTR